MGVFSSAHCVPMAAKVDAAKRFMWANVCVASAVFKGKNLTHVFRPQVHSDQFGEASCSFIAENAKAKLNKDPKDVSVAILYEDGPYGAGVAAGNESKCKELGIKIVHKEGYAATSTDLSALVTKLRISPDWIVSGGQGEMFMPQLEHARWLAAHATQKAQRAEIWRVQERALAWPEPGPPRNRAEAELLAHWRACTKRDRETISDLAARLAPPTA